MDIQRSMLMGYTVDFICTYVGWYKRMHFGLIFIEYWFSVKKFKRFINLLIGCL